MYAYLNCHNLRIKYLKVKISKNLEGFVVQEEIYGVHPGSLDDIEGAKNCPE